MQPEYFRKENQEETYRDIYKDGTKIPFGDGEIELRRVRTKDEKSIRVYKKTEAGGKTCLCMVSGVDNQPELYRNAVTVWFREYARVTLGLKVSDYARKMQVTVGRISIKEQKTRWGSCSSKGNLNFNWKLALMPEQVQDYVVVHELAHRKQMNHSMNFWYEVEKILPDYKARRARLRKDERKYIKY